MVKNRVLPFLSVILLATLPTASFAQDARAVLASVVKAMGAENLKTLQYKGSGSGASYRMAPHVFEILRSRSESRGGNVSPSWDSCPGYATGRSDNESLH